jgi:hypothetical protein
MAFVRIPKRLFAQPTFSKSDTEALYREIIQKIGGQVYTDGVLSVDFGKLDQRNFALHAGITNANISSHFSCYPVQIRLANPTGTVSARASMPFAGDVISPKFWPYILRWTLCFGNTGPSSGTAKLFYTAPGLPEVQLGNAAGQTWAAANPLSIIANEQILPLNSTIDPQGAFRLELAITSGVAKDFVGTIWLTSAHVR